MSDLIGIGASGIRGYSRALQTIGDNIANAQTPGFARRSIVLSDQPGSGDAVLYRNQVSPGGVLATGVTRSTDPWLIQDARRSGSDAARTGAKLTWLEAAESALNDGNAGVGRAMTGVFNRADELAADSSNTARRSAFLQSVDDVATTFRRTAGGLASAADGVATASNLAVGQLNTDIGALTRVNDGLRRARDGSSNQASLLDERDRLLDSITAVLPADIAYDAKGAVSLTVSGGTLLAGADRATLSVTVAGDGRLSVSATSPSGTFSVSPTGGTLNGQVDAAAHIADQRADLNTLANSFGSALNTQHAAGRDSSGNAGRPLMTIGTSAADLVATALTATDVAAADASTANGNALAFGNLRGSSGGEASWATLVAQQSQIVSSARAQDAVATARYEGSASARDSLSAIDLDREAADLLRFQQAYDASARVIQVARETMQSIMNAL